MRVTYEFEKCILCGNNPPENWEHIIPESLGGKLQARLLCISCNSTFGSNLIGKLKLNASIRLAMENLKGEIPKLYSQFMDKATSIGNAKDGSKIRVSNNLKSGPRVLVTTGNDGSRIQDTREARIALEKILTKSSTKPDEKNRLLKIFTEMEEEVPLEILRKYTFIKHRTPPLRPELNSKEKVDERFPTIIAFEFLALLIGNLIITEAFDEIRQYIRYGTPTNRVAIEHFAKSFFAKTREEAKQNIWYELQ